MQVRALIVVRLSNLTDETTSPERQLKVCQRFCEDRGWTVIGVAEDLDVSASTTSPFERPALRPWLDRHHEYEAIVFWRVDRLVRRVTHLAGMIEWGEKHDVNLVSATEAYFDLSTSIGQAMAIMVGVFAQMEADAISERTSQAFEHNIKAGKYRGGHTPLGYMPEKVNGEWRYVHDPVMVKLTREIVTRIIEEGHTPTMICRDLNDRGVLTMKDRAHQLAGREPQGMLWRTGNLTRALRSPTLLGYTVYRPATKKGGKKVYGEPQVLRGEDGAPLVRSEPVLDQATFQRLQEALDRMNGKKTPYKKSEALLLRVIFCGVCGRQMYYNHGRNTTYYRCSSASLKTACGNKAVAVEEADQIVTENLLDQYGDVERHRKVYDPGSDVTEQLSEVDSELSDIAGLVGTPAFRSGAARERLLARLEALSSRRDELAALEHRPAGYRYEPTGQTFAEHWDELTPEGRNMFLRTNEVRLDYKPGDWKLSFNEIEKLKEAVKAS